MQRLGRMTSAEEEATTTADRGRKKWLSVGGEGLHSYIHSL
jgi:hypothetical protein